MDVRECEPGGICCVDRTGLPESRVLFEYAPLWVEWMSPSDKRILAAAKHAVFPRPVGGCPRESVIRA